MIKKYRSYAAWLIPGLQIKRWFLLLFLGTLCMVFGSAVILNLHPVQISMEFIKKFAEKAPNEWTGSLFICIGFILFTLGFRNSNSSLLDAFAPKDRELLVETLYRKRKLDRGPRIVAIGGGTGLSTMLKGIKNITNNITAVVTVGDDGGSSGRLREEMGVLPPGDIRNCIAALADEEELVTKLFQYRFNVGDMQGHSFGNLFVSALCAITGDMVRAVKESSKVLAIRGKVLPSTLDDMRLVAEMEDGRIINGESNIPEAKGKIVNLWTEPKNLRALEDAIDAINDADLIILGPGSLYTSVIPNLLVKEISTAISYSRAKKIYICNIMTQPGETDEYSVSDHVKAVMDYGKVKNLIDAVLVNNSLPKNLAEKYENANSYPVKLDLSSTKKLGVKVVVKRLIEDNKDGLVRHSPKRLARSIYHWYRTAKVTEILKPIGTEEEYKYV